MIKVINEYTWLRETGDGRRVTRDGNKFSWMKEGRCLWYHLYIHGVSAVAQYPAENPQADLVGSSSLKLHRSLPTAETYSQCTLENFIKYECSVLLYVFNNCFMQLTSSPEKARSTHWPAEREFESNYISISQSL